MAKTPLRPHIRAVLEKTEASDGYAVVVGAESDELVDELLLQSNLRLIVIDPDEDRIEALRERFAFSDLYGTRIVGYVGDLATLSLPPYLANLVVVDNPVTEGDFFATIYAALGINHEQQNYVGVRPMPLAPPNSSVISDLLA